MSHEPRIPGAALSPYPLHPEPIASHEEAVSVPADATREADSSEAARTDTETWVDQARETFDRVKGSKVALGAAVGIGSAALLAALLYARRDRHDETRPVTREGPRRWRKSTADA